MNKACIAALLAGSAALTACATTGRNQPVDPHAPVTPATAPLPAIVPGVTVAEGAVIGAAIAGLPNAVWADRNNDSIVDGYVWNGEYYAGTPAAYDPALRRVNLTQSLGPAAVPPPVAAPPANAPAPPPPARGERG